MKPEKIKYNKQTLEPDYKYVICMCPTSPNLQDGMAIALAPKSEPAREYKWKCDICGMEGTYYG